MKTIAISLIFCLLFINMKGQFEPNFAKFKPSWQSSTYINNPEAKFGNDGHRNSDAFYSCSITEHTLNPWWIVDLVEQYRVDKIIIANRDDCCGERLFNFTVEVATSMSSPSDMTKYKMCYHYPGASVTGEILELVCNIHQYGRYVKVQIWGSSFLQLCEVEVYRACETPKTGLFYEWTNTTTVGAVQKAFMTKGKKQCAVRCMELAYCNSFNTMITSNGNYECQLADDTANMTEGIGWSHFSPCTP